MTADPAADRPPMDDHTLADQGRNLRTLADQWETTAPADAALLGYDLHRVGRFAMNSAPARLAEDWARFTGHAGLLHAQALCDLGRYDAAIRAATGAQIAAKTGRDPQTEAMAVVLSAHITARESPRASSTALQTFQAVADEADGSWVAAVARVEEANLLARRDGAGWDVLAAVRSAERCRLGDDLAVGYPLSSWSRGYVASFGGAALVAAGQYEEAAPRLGDALAWSGPDGVDAPGIYAMTLLYQARLRLRTGRQDDAQSLCAQALTVDPSRPMVRLGVRALAAEAPGTWAVA